MKKAFEKYFEKLNKIYEKAFGTKPSVCYTDELNKNLLVSEVNDDGDVQWQAKPQAKNIDLKDIEKELGFGLCDELKEYYCSYLFLRLAGVKNNIHLTFDPINSEDNVEKVISLARKYAENCFEKEQVLLLGIACIDGDDSFSIYYNNKTNELFCYEDDTKKKVIIESGLKQTIATMKASI